MGCLIPTGLLSILQQEAALCGWEMGPRTCSCFGTKLRAAAPWEKGMGWDGQQKQSTTRTCFGYRWAAGMGYREKEFKEQPQEQILVQCGKAGSKSLWKTWLFQVTVLGYASGYYSWILSMWLHCIIAQAGVFINRAIIPWQICAKSVIQPGAGQRGPLTLLLGFSCEVPTLRWSFWITSHFVLWLCLRGMLWVLKIAGSIQTPLTSVEKPNKSRVWAAGRKLGFESTESKLFLLRPRCRAVQNMVGT